ncbi:MAG: hypothetical protein KBS47_05340 [Bacteroidales bacterium]|nr:hypothetical protein [Candidatus Equimonas enterica]
MERLLDKRFLSPALQIYGEKTTRPSKTAEKRRRSDAKQQGQTVETICADRKNNLPRQFARQGQIGSRTLPLSFCVALHTAAFRPKRQAGKAQSRK